MSMPSSSHTGSTCAANASFSSTTSMSVIFIPAWASTLRTASMGPTPMISGASPDTADAMMRARGLSPSARARSSDITSTAAAPSLSGQALPAVTVPPGLNAGSSWASFSSVVPGRGPSSFSTSVPSGSVTGVISRSKKPFFCASTARSCESLANSSMRSRVTPYFSATFSAVSPIGMYMWLTKSERPSSMKRGLRSSLANPFPPVRLTLSTPAAT